MGVLYNANTHQTKVDGVWLDEFASTIDSFREAMRRKILYGGLWPVYTVHVIPPVEFNARVPVKGVNKYFLGKRKMIAYLTKLKLKYPEASFEKY
jgi:hypothetical protein